MDTHRSDLEKPCTPRRLKPTMRARVRCDCKTTRQRPVRSDEEGTGRWPNAGLPERQLRHCRAFGDTPMRRSDQRRSPTSPSTPLVQEVADARRWPSRDRHDRRPLKVFRGRRRFPPACRVARGPVDLSRISVPLVARFPWWTGSVDVASDALRRKPVSARRPRTLETGRSHHIVGLGPGGGGSRKRFALQAYRETLE